MDDVNRVVNPQQESARGPVRVIAVASGKGGVGKTNISVNLACELSLRGRSVMLLDADLGLANVDVLLGCKPDGNLENVVSGERTLDEIVCSGPLDIKIIPAASGVAHMAGLSDAEHASIITAFSELKEPVDVLVVDLAAGISANVTTFARAAQELIIVVCDEPASMTDAYALIKVLATRHDVKHFRILCNMTVSDAAGFAVYQKIVDTATRFLDVGISYLGSVPADDLLKQAARMQRAVVEAYPQSRCASALKKIAEKVDTLPMPIAASGQLEFFVERILQLNRDEALSS
jgi:flagellar biosynthesis protein FlhG